jgi:hypothetical protein
MSVSEEEEEEEKKKKAEHISFSSFERKHWVGVTTRGHQEDEC